MQIAVVTGASSGMGREFVRQLDEKTRLDEIWVIARRRNRLEELAAACRNKVRVLELDLTDSKAVSRYAALLEAEHPTVRVLVNAAGFGRLGSAAETPPDIAAQMIDLNCKALTAVTLATIPYLTRGSRVIQLASCASYQPLPYFNIYAATKAYVKSFSLSLREELRPAGVSVTAVCPGWVKTEFFRHTHAEETVHPPKFYRPITTAEAVVAQALQDAKRGRALSKYGLFNQCQSAAAHLLPAGVLMNAWKLMLHQQEMPR